MADRHGIGKLFLITKRCQFCGKAIWHQRSNRAEYCGPICRAAMYRLERLLLKLPASIETLYQLLRAHAPEQARSYRLILARHDGIWQFPRADGKEWRSFTGRSQRSAFRLWPFEVPTVPTAAIYGVVLRGRGNGRLETPDDLVPGVAVEPVLKATILGEKIR